MFFEASRRQEAISDWTAVLSDAVVQATISNQTALCAAAAEVSISDKTTGYSYSGCTVAECQRYS